VIKRNRADGVVKIQVVLEGSVVTLPPNNIIRTELTLAFPNLTDVLVVDLNSIFCTVHSSFLSSYHAVGLSKSPGLANPFAPIGPSSGSEK
jgi:hypothetical protein